MEDIDLFNIDEQIRKEQLQEENSIKETIAIENDTINKNEVISEKETDEVVESDILSENTENTKNTKNNNTQIIVVEEQAKEGEVVNNPEVDRYINILRRWCGYYDVIPISENSDKYILCRTNTRGPTALTNILPVITKKITYIRRRRNKV